MTEEESAQTPTKFNFRDIFKNGIIELLNSGSIIGEKKNFNLLFNVDNRICLTSKLVSYPDIRNRQLGAVIMDYCGEEEDKILKAIDNCPKDAKALIYGLEFGMVLCCLADSGKTNDVTVFEPNQEIINLVEPQLRTWIEKTYPDFKWEIVTKEPLDSFDWVFKR